MYQSRFFAPTARRVEYFRKYLELRNLSLQVESWVCRATLRVLK